MNEISTVRNILKMHHEYFKKSEDSAKSQLTTALNNGSYAASIESWARHYNYCKYCLEFSGNYLVILAATDEDFWAVFNEAKDQLFSHLYNSVIGIGNVEKSRAIAEVMKMMYSAVGKSV